MSGMSSIDNNARFLSSASPVRDVNFHVNVNTGKVVMRVIGANGTLVKEIPSPAVQKVDANIEQMSARLFDLHA